MAEKRVFNAWWRRTVSYIIKCFTLLCLAKCIRGIPLVQEASGSRRGSNLQPMHSPGFTNNFSTSLCLSIILSTSLIDHKQQWNSTFICKLINFYFILNEWGVVFGQHINVQCSSKRTLIVFPSDRIELTYLIALNHYHQAPRSTVPIYQWRCHTSAPSIIGHEDISIILLKNTMNVIFK